MVSTNIPTAADLTLIVHVVGLPEAQVSVAQTALMIAELEYPELDVVHYTDILAQLGTRARRYAEAHEDKLDTLAAVVRFMYEECGFAGNAAGYYDPRNSHLNDVLERRLGIPITLAIVLIEILRACDVDACGLSTPAHFLVRASDRFIDPFDGRMLRKHDVVERYRKATGDEDEPPASLFEAAPKSAVIQRVLGNLERIYTAQGDRSRQERVASLMKAIARERRAPTPPSVSRLPQ